jgi:hypothetical protein
MRPDLVIVFHPLPYDDLSFFKTVEDLPIQKVVSKGAVKAFTKAIFPRATRFNVSGFHSNTR